MDRLRTYHHPSLGVKIDPFPLLVVTTASIKLLISVHVSYLLLKIHP